MKPFISIKRSQVHHFLETPLYIKNKLGAYVLYKSENEWLDPKRYTEEEFPRLYVHKEMKETASGELQAQLKDKLKRKVSSGDLKSIKSALCEIVQEAMQEPLEENLNTLPETMSILYAGYSDATRILRGFSELQHGGYSLVEHSVNVMLFTLNYCLFSDFSETKIKRLSLAALLHDIGLTQIPKDIAFSDKKLTEQEFGVYKTHPSVGCDIIKKSAHINSTISAGVLEHHEHLDGKGYPMGLADISFDGRLIGLIDSFDNLIGSEKSHRKKKEPFDAMKMIQNEVLEEGKFDKKIYKNLLLSLSGKTRFN